MTQPNFADHYWEVLRNVSLPNHIRDSYLRVYRSKEKWIPPGERLSYPFVRCVCFFPDTSPERVLKAMCDISSRLAWDINYRMFRRVGCDDVKKTNSDSETLEQSKGMYDTKSFISPRDRTPIFCHRVGLPHVGSIGFHSRIFCYERFISCLSNEFPDAKKILSEAESNPKTKPTCAEHASNGLSGYCVQFKNRTPDLEWNIHESHDIMAQIFYQEYRICGSKRDDILGTELTMTSCADVEPPWWLPDGIKKTIMTHLTTRSFLSLYSYLENS